MTYQNSGYYSLVNCDFSIGGRGNLLYSSKAEFERRDQTLWGKEWKGRGRRERARRKVGPSTGQTIHAQVFVLQLSSEVTSTHGGNVLTLCEDSLPSFSLSRLV